jgi:hypothetical protein
MVFARACAAPSRRTFLQYGAVGAVSIYAHFYAGFVLVAQAVAFIVRRPRLPLRLIAGSWAVIGIGLIPFAGYVVAGTRSPVEWIPRLSLSELWSSLWFAAAGNVALLALAVVGAFLIMRAGDRFEAALTTGWIFLPIACGALVSVVKPALVPRFLIVASPAVALLSAVAVMRLAQPAARVLATVVVVGFAIPGLVRTYTQNPENWRAAAVTARAAARQGSTVAVLPEFAWRALDVYAPTVPRVTTPSGRTMTVLVTGNASARRRLVSSFIGRAPYRLVRTDHVGSDFVAERWAHR